MHGNNSKAISRIKRIYRAWGPLYVPKKGKNTNKFCMANMKKCESITEFIEKSNYAKLLKQTGTPYSELGHLEHKFENRKTRHKNKQQLKENIKNL